jgi:hypothetical protein
MLRKKLILTVVTVLAAVLIGVGGEQPAQAELLYNSHAPDGLRIPAEIELLEDTYYYSSPNSNEQEGMFAPQKVKVLHTDAVWPVSGATWEIETMFGPRWIRPYPWTLDIAPPDRILLLEVTPLYRIPHESGGAVTSLSPQEVLVTGAEKQWFYTNDPAAKAWIQVHTTWMGDLWAHIPVNRIGTIQKKQWKAHFEGLMEDVKLEEIMGLETYETHKQTSGDYTIENVYTTIYERAYQIRTDHGLTWTSYPGIELKQSNESLQITSEKPLIRDLWDNGMHEAELLANEQVTAFEKVDVPIWRGRSYGDDQVWIGEPWYHVRTSKGTGWINKLYGEPDSPVPVKWKVDLKDGRELLRYPGLSFDTTSLLLKNETIDVTAFWDDPNGSKWLKTVVEGRSGWVGFHVSQDRIWDAEKGTELQIGFETLRGIPIVMEGGEWKLYDERRIGYETDGRSYADALLMAEQLKYKIERISKPNAVTIHKGDYSYRLEADSLDASIYWQGKEQRRLSLQEKPRLIGEGWYISIEDLRALFGLVQTDTEYEHFLLYEKEYRVELGQLPAEVKESLELGAFVYDWTNVSELNLRLPVTMTIEDEQNLMEEELTVREEAVVSEPGTNRGRSPVQLYAINADYPLTKGNHKLEVTLRVGERILWKQLIHVKVQG